MNQKIAVIGSNSFSGAHFVGFCLEKDLSVIGISRSKEADSVFLPYKNKPSLKFQFHQLDLNHDLNHIMDVLNRFKPAFIVNFAAQSMVAESWQYPEHWFQTNVLSTVRFHNAIRNCKFLEKYVHISTPEVYGTCAGHVSENTHYNPSTPYAVSRAAADMSLMSFYHAYGFPVVYTRAANVYGEFQRLYRIIPKTILFFLTGRKIPLHGGGKSIRSFIHIRDVVDGTLRAALDGQPGQIYHFATEQSISICDLVRMVAEQMKIPFEDNVEIEDDRLGKDTAYLLDSSKARLSLGWADSITLDTGISRTIGWVRDNLDALKRLPIDYIHKP